MPKKTTEPQKVLASVGTSENGSTTVRLGIEKKASSKKKQLDERDVTEIAWTSPEGAIRLMAQVMRVFDHLCEEGDGDLRDALARIERQECRCDECVHVHIVASILRENIAHVDHGKLVAAVDEVARSKSIDKSELH